MSVSAAESSTYSRSQIASPVRCLRNRRHHAFHRIGFQLTVGNQFVSASANATQAPVIDAVRVRHRHGYIAVQRNSKIRRARFPDPTAARSYTRDQTLNFHSTAALLTLCRFARVTGMGSAGSMHTLR